MGKINNIISQRFGKLVVIAEAGRAKRRHVLWLCKCDCGKTTVVTGDNLRSGHTKSCGCLQIEKNRTHGMTKTHTYKAWKDMKARCYNSSGLHYRNYGGRGIIVCEKWRNSFEAFFTDMGERPISQTLDRIDNNGIYEPMNCRWATRKQQARNTRTNRLIEYQGQTKCLSAWAEIIGICCSTLHGRLKAGLIPEVAFQMQKYSKTTNR